MEHTDLPRLLSLTPRRSNPQSRRKCGATDTRRLWLRHTIVSTIQTTRQDRACEPFIIVRFEDSLYVNVMLPSGLRVSEKPNRGIKLTPNCPGGPSEADQIVDLLTFEESLRREYLRLKSIKRRYSCKCNVLLLLLCS